MSFFSVATCVLPHEQLLKGKNALARATENQCSETHLFCPTTQKPTEALLPLTQSQCAKVGLAELTSGMEKCNKNGRKQRPPPKGHHQARGAKLKQIKPQASTKLRGNVPANCRQLTRQIERQITWQTECQIALLNPTNRPAQSDALK